MISNDFKISKSKKDSIKFIYAFFVPTEIITASGFLVLDKYGIYMI